MWAVVPQQVPDTIAEMRREWGGGPNEATARRWMPSHATTALETTPSLFHRQVNACLAFKDATLKESSVSGNLQIPS